MTTEPGLRLDEDGLHTQTQEEIADELAAKVRAHPTFGPNTKTAPGGPIGDLIAMVAETRAIDQQTLLAVYGSFDRAGARGRALDARGALTGTTRKGADYSFVTGILTFSGAGTAPQGMLIHNDDNDTTWKLTNGPLTVASAGDIAAEFTCTTTGPVLANAETTWSAVTVVPNLDGFTNDDDDAEQGRDREKDPEYRARQVVELYSQGQGPLATIKARVSRIDGVVTCRVYHNPRTKPADSDGIPFKAFCVVVETNPATPSAELQQLIFDTIWSCTGAGGQAYGTSYTGTIIDSEGQQQPSAFDVVTGVDIYLRLSLKTSTSEDPITPNLEEVVAARVLEVAQANHEKAGRDVKALDYAGIVYAMQAAGEISGVDEVAVELSFTDSFPDTPVPKLELGIREKADFDSANITVVQV